MILVFFLSLSVILFSSSEQFDPHWPLYILFAQFYYTHKVVSEFLTYKSHKIQIY